MNEHKPLCPNCYSEVDQLVDTPCTFDPELLKGAKSPVCICPDCESYVFTGRPHYKVCLPCAEKMARKQARRREVLTGEAPTGTLRWSTRDETNDQ